MDCRRSSFCPLDSGDIIRKDVPAFYKPREELNKRKQMAMIGQMTAVLAHEIRNALGSMKGYTQLVYEKVPETDPRKPGLAMVLKGSDRIESLVNDLLLFPAGRIIILKVLKRAAL